MTRAQKAWLYASVSAAAMTGLAFAGMKYVLEREDPFSAYNHPLQPHALSAHVLVVPVLVFVVGWVFGAHVVRQARSGRGGRRSGWVMLGAALPMAVTGYLLQVVTSAGWRAGLAWAHGISATGFVLSLVAHAVSARRRARKGFVVVPVSTPFPDGVTHDPRLANAAAHARSRRRDL